MILSSRFNDHLGKKGFSGLITVNYEEKTLSIKVSCFLLLYCTSFAVLASRKAQKKIF